MPEPAGGHLGTWRLVLTPGKGTLHEYSRALTQSHTHRVHMWALILGAGMKSLRPWDAGWVFVTCGC